MKISQKHKDAFSAVVGPKGIIDSDSDLEPYLVEQRGMYRGECDLVVRPKDTIETAKVVKVCHEHGISIVPHGGNTGLVAGGIPNGGIIIDTTRMNAIRDIDPINQTITVEAGVILADIQQAAADVGCLFPLSLGAEGSCRIGGNLSTNAGGVGVLRYGNTRDLTLGLEVVLPDGRVWDGLRALRKDNTGYDLKQLFIGAEGTLGIITTAVLKLYPLPKQQETVVVTCSSPHAALDMFSRAQRAFVDNLTAFEMFPRNALDGVLIHVPGAVDPFDESYPYYALIELSSPREDKGLRDAFESLLEAAFEDGTITNAVVATSQSQAKELWRLRETIPEAERLDGPSFKHDVTVPVSAVADFLVRAKAKVEAEMEGVRVIAFGHMGDGNIHFNVCNPLDMDREEFLKGQDRFNRIVYDIVTDMQGSFSAEHGIGALRRKEMERYKSDVELDLMRRIKSTLDPDNILNPGKVL
ncbi:MAG: FAD-binding oxidoreductase [Rhodospirillales bacterium]|jgi:FAD/FMN-containing dehydrogenase